MLIREETGAAHSTGTQIPSTKPHLNSRCKQKVLEMLGQLRTHSSFIHKHINITKIHRGGNGCLKKKKRKRKRRKLAFGLLRRYTS